MVVTGVPYNVSVALDPLLPSLGTMNIRHEWADSGDLRPEGTLDAHFTLVHALLTFTQVGGGSTFPMAVDLPLDSPTPIYWTHTLGGFRVVGTITEKHPGAAVHSAVDPYLPFYPQGIPLFNLPTTDPGTPEPSSLMLAAFGLTMTLFGVGRRRPATRS